MARLLVIVEPPATAEAVEVARGAVRELADLNGLEADTTDLTRGRVVLSGDAATLRRLCALVESLNTEGAA